MLFNIYRECIWVNEVLNIVTPLQKFNTPNTLFRHSGCSKLFLFM